MDQRSRAYNLLHRAVANQDGGPEMLEWCEQWIDLEAGEIESERDPHGVVRDALTAYRDNRR